MGMMEPPSIKMQKMHPIYTPPGSSSSASSSSNNRHDNPPPGYNPYPPTPQTSPPPPNSPSPPAASSPEPDRPPSRPNFCITLLFFILVMICGYLLIAYIVIPGWKEVVKEAERIEAKMRGYGTTSEAQAQFNQSHVVPMSSNLRLKEERNERSRSALDARDMTPTETAEIYHVSNRIVVPQLTGAAVPTGIDADGLVSFDKPLEGMEAASGFVVEEKDTSKEVTSKETTTAPSDDGGDKKPVNNKRDLNNNNTNGVLKSRGVARRRAAINNNISHEPAEPKFQLGSGWLTLTPAAPATPPPSESSLNLEPDHPHELEPRGWDGHDDSSLHNKPKEEEQATPHEMVEVTKTMGIEEKETPSHIELPVPVVLQPPGGGGGGAAAVEDYSNVSNDKRRRDRHLAPHDPVPPAAAMTKSKPEYPSPKKSSQEQQKKGGNEQQPEKKHYLRPDLEAAKKNENKSPLVQAVEDVANRFGQNDDNFRKHVGEDNNMYNKRDSWINLSPQNNPKPKDGADPTPRKPKTSVNLGENYGTEGLHKMQGTVLLADGRTYYPYGDHYSFRRGDREYGGWPPQGTSREWRTTYPHGGRFARRPAPTPTASHQYGAGAAPSIAAVLSQGESHAENYDVESHKQAGGTHSLAASHPAAASHAAAAPHHRPEYWHYPYQQRPDGGKLDVLPTHDNNGKLHHGKKDEGMKGKEDNGKGHHGSQDKSEGMAKGNKGKGKGSFHSRRSPNASVGVTHLDWANDVEYGNAPLMPRSVECAANGVNNCGQTTTENNDCSNNADGSSGESGHSRRSELEPDVHHGDGDGDGRDHKAATPLHPNPKVRGWNNWFRGRVGSGGINHRKGEKEKETGKDMEKKVTVKVMKCGVELAISKTSANGSSVTATASLTVRASPKWWPPHPHLKTSTVSSTSTTPTPTPTPIPTATAAATNSKPTTTTTTSSSSSEKSPSHSTNKKNKKRAVAPDYNAPHRETMVLPGIKEIRLTPEEAKPEIMDAKYDYWEFKAPPDLYYVSDQDSPFNPYAGARAKRKQEAEEAERKKKEQEERDKHYWHYFKKRPDAMDAGCKEQPDSLGRVWCLVPGSGDLEYPDERGV